MPYKTPRMVFSLLDASAELRVATFSWAQAARMCVFGFENETSGSLLRQPWWIGLAINIRAFIGGAPGSRYRCLSANGNVRRAGPQC